MSLSTMRPCDDTTPVVLLIRNGLEMGRVAAVEDPTEVVDLQAVRNRSDEQLVGNSMGERRGPSPPAASDYPVAPVVQDAMPKPAGLGLLDTPKEPVRKCRPKN